MNIIINNNLMIPIYEQISNQIKSMIRDGILNKHDNLPSVRTLSKDLKISALTVKKAYDLLESEGLVCTIHGKGTYITAENPQLLAEEQKREVERELEEVINKARFFGIDDNDIRCLFELILEG